MKKILERYTKYIWILILGDFVGSLFFFNYFIIYPDLFNISTSRVVGSFSLLLLQCFFQYLSFPALLCAAFVLVLKLISGILIRKKYLVNWLALVLYVLECFSLVFFYITLDSILSTKNLLYGCYGFIFDLSIVVFAIYNIKQSLNNHKTGDGI